MTLSMKLPENLGRAAQRVQEGFSEGQRSVMREADQDTYIQEILLCI